MLTQIGIGFNKLRAKNKTEAWKWYQRRLNEEAGVLCEIMTPKDIIELSMKIENDIKADSGAGTGDPLDEVRLFLGPK